MANVMDMFRLDGKIAIITGGSGRYGRQMVLALGMNRSVEAAKAQQAVTDGGSLAAEL